MAKDTELAWLAGLWDGEGSITIFTHVEKNGAKKICPTLLVVNTDQTIIAEAARLLDEMGTSFAVFERKNPSDKHKDCYQLSTRNMAYIKTVLEAILPYLVGKKPQAQLVLRYVNKKLTQRETNGRPRYDENDYILQAETQALNKRGKPTPDTSTTKGETTSVDDIV